MKRIIFIASIFVTISSFAQSTQNLVLEKIYLKWLVDGSTRLTKAANFCWALTDEVIQGQRLPFVESDQSGAHSSVRIEIPKSSPECAFVEQPGAGWRVIENTDSATILELKFLLPFSRFSIIDSRGRKIEVLSEARLSEIEESNFLKFFRDSIFSSRVSALKSSIWQYPFFSVKFELPTQIWTRPSFQLSMGQNFLDFSGQGIRQGKYEFGIAIPILGHGSPHAAPFLMRIRGAYEGTQVYDEKSLNIYPILATRMLGGGAEIFKNFSQSWGAHLSGSYYLSPSINARLNKSIIEGSVNHALSHRWRIELGTRYEKLDVVRTSSQLRSGFQELDFFVGLQVRPYLN